MHYVLHIKKDFLSVIETLKIGVGQGKRVPFFYTEIEQEH